MYTNIRKIEKDNFTIADCIDRKERLKRVKSLKNRDIPKKYIANNIIEKEEEKSTFQQVFIIKYGKFRIRLIDRFRLPQFVEALKNKETKFKIYIKKFNSGNNTFNYLTVLSL